MPAWIVWTLIPLGLMAIAVSAAFARTSSGRRKAAYYAIALLIGAFCMLGIVYMTVQETGPGGWGAIFASTAAGLLLLYLWERRSGGKTDQDIPPA